MKWSRSLTRCAALAVLIACGGLDRAAAQESEVAPDFETRIWKDSTGDHQVEAKLVDYDRESLTVRLQRKDGKVIDIPLTQLSRIDRQRVVEIFRPKKVERQADPGEAKAPESKATARSTRRPKHQVDTVEIQGLEWVPNIDDAALIAQGREDRTADDRPIMWFRVLGDMEGYM